MKKFAFVALLAGFMVAGLAPAKADYFVKQDPEFRYTFSVPDTWYEVGGLSPRLTHTFMAPGTDGAGCTIYSEKDKRFLTHKSDELAVEVDRVFSQEDFVVMAPRMNIGKNEALNPSVVAYQKGGLGDAFSRYAVVDYIAMSGLDKRSIIFATLYGDMKMMVSCQARKKDFEKRFPEFMGVITSLDFKNFYRAYPTLYYRDFLGTDKSALELWFEDLSQSIERALNK